MKSLLAIILALLLCGCTNAQKNNELEFEKSEKLTLEKVKELSQKGEELTWSDFEEYNGREVGSGLYIMAYDVDDEYRLMIGGAGKEERPMYIYLSSKLNNYFVDIRTANVDEFLLKSPSENAMMHAMETLSIQTAIENGYYVIDDGTLLNGEKEWGAFLDKAAAGESAEINIAHFLDSGTYLETIFYENGEYSLYKCNPETGYTKGSFKYLRPLMGYDGIPRKEATMYVLTDSLLLTFHDVWWSFLSSNTETVTKIPFVWVGAATYMQEKRPSERFIQNDLILMAEEIASKGDPLSSNPYEYIEANKEQFDALCAAGENAVPYINSILRETDKNGLTGYILAAACAEITGKGQEEWSSAKEWLEFYEK